jgi:hypothetical protein
VSDLLDPKDVERVARAICCSQWVSQERRDPATCKCGTWQHHVRSARAAIRAMQPAPLPVVRFKEGERDV